MPRKKAEPLDVEALVLDHGQQAYKEPEKVDPDTELDNVFADLPQNEACIELFRTSALGGRPVYLETMMPVLFSLGYIAEHYGGGRYVAHGKYKDGSARRSSFEIEGEPFPIQRRRASNKDPYQPVDPVRPTAPVLHTTNGIVNVEDQRPANQQGDLVTLMMGMMERLTSQTKNSEMEFLEKLRLYKEILGGGERKEAPLDQALSMLKQGIELGQMNSGEGGGSSIWLMALDKLKEPLTKIVDTVQIAIAQGTRKPPVTNVPVQPVAMQPGESQPVEPEPEKPKEENMILSAVKSMLPVLMNGAAKGSDPGLYVDFLLDQLPQPFYTKALSWLMEPDCLDQLAQKEPAIRYQQEWWTTLRSGLIEALNEELGHAQPVQPEPPLDPATNGSAGL